MAGDEEKRMDDRTKEMAQMDGKKLRIGTRGSRLALAQTALVEEALRSAWPGLETETVILRTKGDRVQDKPLSQVGQKGVFVSEFETALLEGRIDLAVHSAKDLPVRLAEGLDILAVLPRADARDVLVLPVRDMEKPAVSLQRSGGDAAMRAFAAFPEGALIGTGSLRRQLYGKRLCPQADFALIRGNVDSRLKKLQDSGYDGIILAKAGLDRLGIPEREREHFVFLPIPESAFLPAACQGIIAVEGRCQAFLRRLAEAVDDPLTRLAFETERRALLNFGADCSAPAAAYCRVLMPDGSMPDGSDVQVQNPAQSPEEEGGRKRKPEEGSGETRKEKSADSREKACVLRLELSVMYAGRKQSGTAPEAQRLELADALCKKVREADARKGRTS